jgi:hypothetical protein
LNFDTNPTLITPPKSKTTLRWQLVASVDTFQSYVSCSGKYGKPINN